MAVLPLLPRLDAKRRSARRVMSPNASCQRQRSPHGGRTTTLCFRDRLLRVDADQVVDEPRMRVALILFRNGLHQVVGAFVTAKRPLEVRDIVVILSNC